MLDKLRQLLGSVLADWLTGEQAESRETAEKAVGALLPVLLGGIVQMGATPEGAERLVRTCSSATVNDSVLDGFEHGLPTEEGVLDRAAAVGPGLAGMLFGDKTGALSNALAFVSGMRPSSTARLLALATPLTFAVLKREIRARALDAAALRALLIEQRATLQAELDRRLLSALGATSVNAYLADIPGSRPAEAPPPETASGGSSSAGRTGSGIARFAPWLALALALVLVWPLLRSCG